MNKRRLLNLSLLVGALALSACAGPVQRKVEATVARDTAIAKKARAPASAPIIAVSKDKWLIGRAVRVETPMPRWVHQFVTLNSTRPLTIHQIAAMLATNTGVNVQIDPSSVKALMQGAGQDSGQGEGGEKRIVVSYSGDLDGLLDQVAASFGLYWHITDGSVVFFAQETRTFHLPALPISVTNTGTITTTAGSTAASTGASNGAPTTTGSGTIMQTDNLNVNTWATIQQTAQAVAGQGATVITDPSNAMLVVSGSPSQIQRVADWVASLSASMRKLIAIDVQVYDVSTNNENQVGFNPSVLFKDLGQRYGFSISGIAAPQPTSGVSPMSIGASILSPLANGGSGTLPSFGPVGTDASGHPVYLPNQGFYGSQGVVQALATLGKVSKVVSRSVVTLNGQPATLQSATQTGYLASSSSVAAVNAGVTQSAQPGSVTTGFTAILTPRVVHGDILLGMDMTLSSLLGITTQTSGNAQIQTPSISVTGFSQSAAIKPGQTLMLTGFRQAGAQSTKNGVGSPDFQALGGGHDASTSEHHLVILVTARLVN